RSLCRDLPGPVPYPGERDARSRRVPGRLGGHPGPAPGRRGPDHGGLGAVRARAVQVLRWHRGRPRHVAGCLAQLDMRVGPSTVSIAAWMLCTTSVGAHVLCSDSRARAEQAKSQLVVLADGLLTFDRLTVRELLTYVGLIRGMEARTVEERTDSLLAALDLAEEDGKLVVDYSAGMTKKILLASALIHGPRLLVLDEPLEAVDPVSAQVIRKILTAYVGGGGTVVLSSHVMELVEGLCSHVAIIARGELLADGTLDEVRRGG